MASGVAPSLRPPEGRSRSVYTGAALQEQALEEPGKAGAGWTLPVTWLRGAWASSWGKVSGSLWAAASSKPG